MALRRLGPFSFRHPLYALLIVNHSLSIPIPDEIKTQIIIVPFLESLGLYRSQLSDRSR